MKLHRTNKTPGKTSASTAVRRLALWAERYQKIARLHPLCSCIQSNPLPIHNSLRSIIPATITTQWEIRTSSP